MSLASYLAKNYLTASPSSSTSSTKKRKRKQPPSSGLIIADDDALGWTSQPTESDIDRDDGRPLTVSSGSAEFRKAKKSAWKTVGVPALQPPPTDSDQDAADKIISAAAAENAASLHQDEEPAIADDGEALSVVKMGDGTHAGLQSAAAVSKQYQKRKREEAEAWAREQGRSGAGAGAGTGKMVEETVYRDATGRRIDISMRRQEARREQDEQARKAREELEAQKGDVQRLARERRREELDEARFMPVARTVDDEAMNRELRDVQRWNDPAAQFLSKKEAGRSASGKPLYWGAAKPNRYAIRPGHRWDGVDRGNGWEEERFKVLNRTERNKDLNYTWQMDE